jgi:hypothetical protein
LISIFLSAIVHAATHSATGSWVIKLKDETGQHYRNTILAAHTFYNIISDPLFLRFRLNIFLRDSRNSINVPRDNQPWLFCAVVKGRNILYCTISCCSV